MQVKDLLLEALARANHCQRGFGAEASEVSMAEKQFNSQLRKYSDQNMVTAYQKVFDFVPTSEKTIVGAPSYKKGVRVQELDELPNADVWGKKLVAGRDYIFVKNEEKYYAPEKYRWTGIAKVRNSSLLNLYVIQQDIYNIVGGETISSGWHTDYAEAIPAGETIDITIVANNEEPVDPDKVIGMPWLVQGSTEGGSGVTLSARIMSKVAHYRWKEISKEEICEFIPDVKLNDMERIMSVMERNEFGAWSKLNFVPLTEFYTADKGSYNSSNAGENKIALYFQAPTLGKDVKLVYNSSMKFGKNDYLELPEAHIELLTLATTCAILREDCDADPTQLRNYSDELKAMEDQIISSTAVQRRIQRDCESLRYGSRLDYLASGSWIFGR